MTCEEVVKLKKINNKLYNKLTVVKNEKNSLFDALNVSIEISMPKTQKDALDKELKSSQENQQKSASQKVE